MASQKIQNLTIKLTASGTDTIKVAFDKISESTKTAKSELVSWVDTVDASTGAITRKFNIIASSIDEAKATVKAFQLALDENEQKLNNISDIQFNAIEKTKNEVESFRKLQIEKERIVEEGIRRERIAVQNGSESLIYLKEVEKQRLLEIEREKQEKLAALRERYVKGEIKEGELPGTVGMIEGSAGAKIRAAQQPVNAFLASEEERKNFLLIERRLEETNKRREQMVSERELTIFRLEQASQKRRLESQRQFDLNSLQEAEKADKARIAAKRSDTIGAFEDAAKAEAEFLLVEKALQATNARREKLVQEREETLNRIEQAGIEKRRQANIQALTEQDRLMSSQGKGNASLAASAFVPSIREREEAIAAIKQLGDEGLAQIKQQVAMAREIKVSGANSANVALLKAEQDANVIYTRLAKERIAIQQQVDVGSLSKNQAAIQQANALAQATKELIDIQKQLPEILQKTGNHTQTLGEHFSRMARHIAEVYIAWGIMNAVSTRFREAIYSVIPVGIALDSVRATLESTVESSAGAESAIAALGKEAKRTGIEISAIRTSFTTFQASTSLAGASLEDTWKMFTNLNTVITALHKTTDEANHIFLAMSQIFNKSKVQSEELVKQLGNLLPGAFAAFANSMSISTEELSVRMKKGIVYAQDTMLEFTKFLAERFGASFAIASTMLNADINRMKTAFTNLGEAIYYSTSGPIQGLVKGITSFTEFLTSAVNGTNEFAKALSQGLNVALAAATATIVTLTAKIVIARLETLSWAKSWEFTKSLGSTLTSLEARIGAVTAVLVYSALQTKDAWDKASEPFSKLLEKMQAIKDFNAEQAKVDSLVVDPTKDREYQESLKQDKAFMAQLKELEGKAGIDVIRIPKEDKELYEKLFQGRKIPETTAGLTYVRDAVKLYKDLSNSSAEITINAYKAAELKEKERVAAAKLKQEQSLPGIDPGKALKKSDELKAIAQEKLNLADRFALEKSITKEIEARTEAIKLEQNYEKQLLKEKNAPAYENLNRVYQSYDAVGRPTSGKAFEEMQKAGVEASRLAVQEKAELEKIEIEAQLKIQQIQKKTTSETLKDTRVKYKENENDLKTVVKTTEEQLFELGNAYKRGEVSIASYFQKKHELESQEIAAKGQTAEQNLALAASVNDTAAMSRYQNELQQVAISGRKLQEKIDQEKYQALEEYNKLNQEIHIQWLENNDQEEQAALERYENEHRAKLKSLETEAREGTPGAEKALQEARQNAEVARSKSAISKIEKQIALDKEAFQQREKELDLSHRAGVLDDLTFQDQLFQTKQEYIKKVQEQLELEKTLAVNDAQRLAIAKKQTELRSENVDRIGSTQSYLRNVISSSPLGFVQQGMQNLQNMEQERQQIYGLQESDVAADAAKRNISAHEELLDRKSKADKNYITGTTVAYTGMFGKMAGMAADSFAAQTEAAVKMHGRNSQEARKAFALYKATRIAEATMATAQAVVAQLANPTPYVGIALAAVAAAMGAVQIAQISSQQMPAAHGGLDNVPAEQTYLLNKGERIISPKQNVSLMKAVETINSPEKNNLTNSEPKIRIINAVDESVTIDHMGSVAGERVIMNVIRKYQAA